MLIEAASADDRDIVAASYVSMLRLVAEAAPADFAVAFGAARHLAEWGIVGHAISSCGTLRRAFEIWLRFADIAGDPLRYRWEIDDQVWRVVFLPTYAPGSNLARFCAEEFAGSFLRFANETTGFDGKNAATRFMHHASQGVDYATFIPGTVQFSAITNDLTLPGYVLDMPIVSRDDELFNLLVQHLAVKHPAGASDSIAHQLRQVLIASPEPERKLHNVATALGLSPRTLNRKLTAEGTSFTHVLAEFRNDYAKALLRDGTLGTKQISHVLGFRNDQSLRRAFLQWNDIPLGAWRNAYGKPSMRPVRG
ncbi:AraC family transcriptional regulator [Acidocella aquatica]|uniref:AraC family transcriptional regulator n=2 Tax=Acidocella aquatica TaxID=1922313 RepID=A0ABQ6A659_9PROT|nr:AraC family transcriptional regulator [Acidocella aquatica]